MKVSSNFTALFCFLVLSSSVSAAADNNNKKKRRKHRTRGLSSEQKKRDLLNKNLLTETGGFDWGNVFADNGVDSFQWHLGNSGKGFSTGKGAAGGGGGESTGKGYGGGRTRGRDLKKHNTGRIRSF